MNRVGCTALLTASLIACSLHLAGCATAPVSDAGKSAMRSDAETLVWRAKRHDITFGALLTQSPGYAVFPTVNAAAVAIGGGYGRGVLYESRQPVGYCDLSQGTIGLQIGSRTYSEIIVFESSAAIDAFKKGGLRVDAQASAVGITAGAGADANFTSGVAVFTFDEEGLMYEACVGDQNFTFEPY